MTEKKFQRDVAYKVRIQELLQGTFTEEEEKLQLVTPTKKLHRVNLVAIIVQKEKVGSITVIGLDDGSGKITAKIFEEIKYPLEVGDPVRVIGKVRRFNEEKYVSPEIIKKTSPSWLKLRSIEFPITASQEEETKQEEVKEEEPLQEQEVVLPFEKISLIIKKLDDGGGVPIVELIEASELENTEQIIEKMLEMGEIFQNSPGKVKVL